MKYIVLGTNTVSQYCICIQKINPNCGRVCLDDCIIYNVLPQDGK